MLKGVLKDLVRVLYGQNCHAFADGLGDIVDILRIFFWYDDGVNSTPLCGQRLLP